VRIAGAQTKSLRSMPGPAKNSDLECRRQTMVAGGDRTPFVCQHRQRNIYCFAEDGGEKPVLIQAPDPIFPAARFAAQTEFICAHAQAKKGYCLILNGSAALACELAQKTQWRMCCVIPTRQLARPGAKSLKLPVWRTAWLYSTVPSIRCRTRIIFSTCHLCGRAAGKPFDGSRDEIRRVLRPYGGWLFWAR